MERRGRTRSSCVRDVYRTFDVDTAAVRALRGADLDVAAGEFVAITGPSGCGKSTLLSIIAGLEVPDDGVVEVAGHVVSALGPDERAIVRRRAVGVVFQFFNLLESMTAAENVAVAAMLGGATRRAAGRRARELLDLLGLADKVDALPPRLSGGQRQRLAIARAMANSPAVLLADEPTGALDTDGGRRRAASSSADSTRPARRSSWSPTTATSPPPPSAPWRCVTGGWSTTTWRRSRRGQHDGVVGVGRPRRPAAVARRARPRRAAGDRWRRRAVGVRRRPPQRDGGVTARSADPTDDGDGAAQPARLRLGAGASSCRTSGRCSCSRSAGSTSPDIPARTPTSRGRRCRAARRWSWRSWTPGGCPRRPPPTRSPSRRRSTGGPVSTSATSSSWRSRDRAC